MDKNRIFGAALLSAPLAMGLMVSPAQAHFTFTIDQVGSNVVVTGSGAIDLTAMTLQAGQGAVTGVLFASLPVIGVGDGSPNTDHYTVSGTGPGAYGAGGIHSANVTSGDPLGFIANSSTFQVYVPIGYVSGSLLSNSATYDNATFASLGLTVGTYTYAWGSGAHADDITLKIEDAPAPVPGAGLLSLAFFALVAARGRAGSLLKSALGRG